MIFFWEILREFFVERLHDFVFWRRGCVILFFDSLRDFVCEEVV